MHQHVHKPAGTRKQDTHPIHPTQTPKDLCTNMRIIYVHIAFGTVVCQSYFYQFFGHGGKRSDTPTLCTEVTHIPRVEDYKLLVRQ